MKKSLLLGVFAFLLPCSSVYAGELSGKMDTIAKQFARDAEARVPPLTGAALAVFPYNCDEKLAKKRVDLAVEELLTARLPQNSSFKLVERSQLETVLKEQKLGLSGAIESKTAAEVGKLTGARLAALGTVTRIGKTYQISSKLVDTETAEIISVSIVEVPISVFDEEAARYLTLVPEREALGLYTGFSYWPITTKSLPPVETGAPLNKTVTPVQASGNYAAISVGLRYQVARKWLLDIVVLPTANLGTLVKFTIPGVHTNAGTMDGMGGRISLNRTTALSDRWKLFYGAGYQAHGWVFFHESTPKEVIGGATQLRLPNSGPDLFGAFARGGLEWRVKERFGWSLTGQLNQPGKITCELNVQQGDTVLRKVKIMEAQFPIFFLETTFAFYF